MSTDAPDSEEMRLRYEEIANLKKSIAEKQALKNRREQNIARINKQQHANWRMKKGNPYNPQRFQNMKLIVNNVVPNQTGKDPSPSLNISTDKPQVGSEFQQQYISSMSKGGMSLYKSNIYQQEVERIKEVTALKRQQIEQEKYSIKMKNRIAKYRKLTDSCDRIKINGDKYAVTKFGKTLVPIKMFQLSNPNSCEWNGSQYARGKNGAFKKVGGNKSKKMEYCRYYSRTGICQKGSNCKYIHDKEKIRVCPYYLSGGCTNRNCLLSHSSNDNNTPLCRFYLENKCFNSQCRFSHSKPEHYDDPNYEIWSCRPFVMGSFCLRGKKCPFLHLMNCPDFEEDNYCPKGHDCMLNHQYTLRTQEMISSKTNKYIRDDTLVEEENNASMPQKERSVISSYTVDPATLFVKDEMGNYQFYVDNNGKSTGETSTPSNEFLIEVSDSSDEEEEADNGDDELQHNDDYVDI